MTLRDQSPRSPRAVSGRRLLALMTAMTLGLSGTPAFAAPPKSEDGDPLVSPKPALPQPKKDDKAKPSTPKPRPPKPKSPAGGPAVDTELTGDESGVAYNSCKRQPPGSKFRITLPKETELEDLVNWMMTVSCQKFIWDRKVRSGKVTILSPEPVTLQEAYAAFYAALQTMGLTVEPSGRYFKIVETADAKSKNLPVYDPGRSAPNNDRFVTQLFRIRAGNTKDIVDLLNKLKSKQGSVDSSGDLIILTDTGSSVRRLRRVMNQIDDPAIAGEKIYFFQLQHADAEEVAEIVRNVFGEEKKKSSKGKKGASGAEGPSFSRVIVDQRSGTLIIVSEASHYEVIRRLIERLDVPMAGGGGRIHVVRLENADAQEVANVLSQLASGAKQGGGKKKGKAPAAASAELFSGEVKVTPDVATRSLVILASQRDFMSLQKVIDRLDSPRLQVYLEVFLLEVDITKGIEGGASGHFGTNFSTSGGDGLGFVASAPSASGNSILLSPDMLSGIAGGILGPEVPGSGQFLGLGRDIPAFGVIIQALQNSNDVNIVAEPHMYTADNQEATIEVGRNVPTPGGLTFPGGGSQSGGLVPVQSVTREDVTLRVKVTPHINDENTVTLDVELDDRDIVGMDETLGVTTSKRRLKLDKIVANDDQPVVLGGLIKEEEREEVRQVPGLGSIPVLGWLFKSKRKTRRKVNLLMILVPHIVETPDDIRRIHERRTRERMEFIERETSFKKRDLPTSINFRKKSGLLASINTEAARMEKEERDLAKAEAEMMQMDISGELGMSIAPPDAEPEESDAPSKAGKSTKKPSRPKPTITPSKK